MSKAISLPPERRAHDLHVALIHLSGEVTSKFFEMGEIMKEIRDNNFWQIMGYDSFESYFSDPELAYSKSSVYHAIALVENFPEWRDMEPLPISKMIMLVPHLTPENRPKLLELAKGLSRSDLQQELGTLATASVEGYHALPKIYRCNNCQGIKGVFFNDLCRCGWTEEQRGRVKKIIAEVNQI